jgi:predicted ATP-grasp superfamily ATP-dependent carboligase
MSPAALREVARHAAASERPPGIVVNVGWVNGLAAVRSLGRARIPAVALDAHAGALGFRSRYAIPVRTPDPAAEEEAFAELLTELAGAIGRPAPIFPTHDDELNAVARAAPRLRGSFLCPFPAWDLLEGIQRKRTQLEAAAAVGVPIPATAYPQTAAEALAAAGDAGYPVLVKPSDPSGFKRRFRRQAFRCETAAELERAYEDAEPFAPMVQELVPGGDDELWTLGSYLATDGQALGLFCGRKLRQTPPVVGTCRVGEARWEDEVVEQGLRLLAALRFRGISQVEFKRDPRDGRYKLMEVNARLWQWHGLAAACGVDVVRIAYRDLLGDRPAPVRMAREGLRWAIGVMAGAGTAFQRPPYVDAVFALDDPRPGLVQLARVARRVLR